MLKTTTGHSKYGHKSLWLFTDSLLVRTFTGTL